jgi:2-oxoglutarate ferredoxin oxidoreductase subunit delta
MGENIVDYPPPKTSKAKASKPKNSLKIVIESNFCKGCGYCIAVCPKGVLSFTKEISARGFEIAEVVHPENCIQCRNCELACPDLAIYLEDISSQVKEKGGCDA